MSLLLIGDEQEDMILKYLDRGRMFIVDDGGVKAECVVTDEGDGIVEIKNIAVLPEYRRVGYGAALLRFVCEVFSDSHSSVIAGTGESPLTIPFYKKCGFVESHRVTNFFTDNYDHEIIECGVKLTDMVYLRKNLK